MSPSSTIDIDGMPLDQVEAIAKAAYGANPGLYLGPWFIAIIFDCIALGIVSQQYLTWWIYSRQTENFIRKWLTHGLVLISLAFTITSIADAMHHLIYNFGTWRIFLKVQWQVTWPIIICCISAPVQLFYSERSFRLNKRSWPLLGLLSLLIAASLAMCLWQAIVTASFSSILQTGAAHKIGQAWMTLTLAVDILITLSVSFGLWRSRTGWSSTDRLLRKIFIITLETQLGPTLGMLAWFIQVSIDPMHPAGAFFEMILSKVYVIGYLATLNSRYTLLRQLNADSIGHIGETATEGPYDNMFISGSGRLHQATVHVESDTHIESFKVAEQKDSINREVDSEGKGDDAIEYNAGTQISAIRPTDRKSLV
ncbi:hypothetical protein IAU60_003465 [Kwoniella sp. DSM 27419]